MVRSKKKDRVVDSYFRWMCKMVTNNSVGHPDIHSYYKLFSYLHSTPFRYSLALDANRESDGVDLRNRFGWDVGYDRETIEDCLFDDQSCSVLEMMIALSIRCEENIMSDPYYGDRTSKWFWGMIKNLKLASMNNANFDIEYVENIISNLLDRNYSPTGIGGLFTVKNRSEDLRETEIWYQMCWYLNNLSRR